MFKIRKKIDNESFNKMEEISLYNGKKAYLEYVNDNPQSFIIRAKDCHGNVVGTCYFNIEKLFKRKLSEEERQERSAYFGGLDNTPVTESIYIDNYTKRNYKIEQNVLYDKKDGKEIAYYFDFAKCHLQIIEIKDKEYFKTGLGTLMFKVMEQFAIQEQCFQIYARYQPYGDFASGTHSFYIKNGFTIEADHVDRKCYATKNLPLRTTNTSAVTSPSSPTKDGEGK